VENINNKKIILTGPPGTGKTTIKKVYFELANPIRLIDDTLDPTRGVNTSVFSLFKKSLGVFDLAGQENEIWFSAEKQIFNHSSVIICVFEIRNSLKQIVQFLMNILKIQKELQLYECKIIIFLHKIDLVKTSYLLNKVRTLKKIFEVKFPELEKIQIFRTSIAEQYFLKTYFAILDVLNLIFFQDLIPIQKELFNILKTDLSIILQFDVSLSYSWNVLKNKFDLELSQALSHLERLSDLNLLEIKNINPFTFSFTDRAKLFKICLEKEISKVEKTKLNKGVELFYTFLNLKRNNSYN